MLAPRQENKEVTRVKSYKGGWRVKAFYYYETVPTSMTLKIFRGRVQGCTYSRYEREGGGIAHEYQWVLSEQNLTIKN
jgi:hypothetical protein